MKLHVDAMKAPIIMLLNLILFSGNLPAQKTIVGEILSGTTKAPIEYAHIFLLSNQNRGVFSNQVGKFQISVADEQQQDTLVVSQIGYETVLLPMAQLQADTNRIFLKETIYNLGEVTVTDEETLKNIFRKAIQKIPEQYGDSKAILKAYFQEYTIAHDAYGELIEAFVHIQDMTDYSTDKGQSKFQLEALRKSDDLRAGRKKRFIEEKYNQLCDLYERYNYVKNRSFHPTSGNLGEKFFKKFTFRKLGEYVQHGDTLIKISYTNPKMFPKDEDRSAATGEVIINKSDFGILSVKRDALPQAGVFQETTYQKVNGKYYPLKITTELCTSCLMNGNAGQLNVRTLIIHDIDPSGVMPSGPLLNSEENLRTSNLPYDPEFWKENEIIQSVPAPELMKRDMERSRSLDQQFERNAKQKK